VTENDRRGGTVLLEIDWQTWIVALGHDPSAADGARRVRAVARAQGWPVLCSRYLSTDADDPERSDPDGPGARFVDGLGPGHGDVVVTKHGRDVFDAVALEEVLAGLRATHLVLTGVATDHGVMLAARSAVARGLRVTVVADACAGTSARAHATTLSSLPPAGAQVVDVAELETRR
jgi:nicotinamidase-related amidase